MQNRYLIAGGEAGRARLRVLADAFEPSTIALLEAAGIVPGMRCLDLACGGGDVTLAMARIVGPQGRVVGIDMDPVKIDLAAMDAADQKLTNVDLQSGDVTELDAEDEYDLVYARFLLTHLRDPDSTLRQMATAVKPGGSVVVEDIEHSGSFTYPSCAALARFDGIYNEAARRRGGDPNIGPKLPGMFTNAGLEDVRLRMVQPVFLDGEAKRIPQITLENIVDSVISAGLATEEELESVVTELDEFASDPTTIVALPRVYGVFGRRPLARRPPARRP